MVENLIQPGINVPRPNTNKGPLVTIVAVVIVLVLIFVVNEYFHNPFTLLILIFLVLAVILIAGIFYESHKLKTRINKDAIEKKETDSIDAIEQK